MNDLGELLRRAAREPTRAVDVDRLQLGARHRVGMRRGVLAVVVAGVVGVGGSLLAGSPEGDTTVAVESLTTTSTAEAVSSSASSTPSSDVEAVPATGSTVNTPTTATPSTTSTTIAAQSQERFVELPTHSEAFLPGELVFATLDGDLDVDGGCLWLVRRDGVLMSVRWASGFQARFYTVDGRWTFELRDGNGTVVAREGDRLTVGGGQIPAREERLPRCQVSDAPPYYLSPEITQGWE